MCSYVFKFAYDRKREKSSRSYVGSFEKTLPETMFGLPSLVTRTFNRSGSYTVLRNETKYHVKRVIRRHTWLPFGLSINVCL